MLAVDHAALDVARGSVYALVGRNGAGKSSLVRCLLGQQKPQQGSASLFGEDAWSRRTSLMQRIGVVTEDADAPPEMSVAAIARFCSRLYDKWDQDSVETRLRTFGVPLTSRFGSLSKGQQKQVSLAMALAISPELLVLDDPTLGLDVVARKSLFEEVIGDLADRGTTVFITTHDLAGVETFADRVLSVKPSDLTGHIDASGSPIGPFAVISGNAKGHADYRAAFLLNTEDGSKWRLDPRARWGVRYTRNGRGGRAARRGRRRSWSSTRAATRSRSIPG
jgi:ABC-2 type transport system ATP-binding protein